MTGDPYRVLGVSPDASEAEVRAAYRRLVKLHHPDHNQGSPEAARRFEEVQEAYAAIHDRRGAPAGDSGTGAGRPPRSSTGASGSGRRSFTGASGSGRGGSSAGPGPAEPPGDSSFERRLADLEAQVRRAHQAGAEAQRARDDARRAAREAALRARQAARGSDRTTDEELGYVTTDDSLGQILADARDELAQRYGEAREHPVARRVSDLISGLEDLADGLDRGARPRKRPQ